MIPYHPQTVDVLYRRYAAAIEHTYDHDAVLEGREARPGELPQHVFDFQSGLRLIISSERENTGRVFIHISASALPGTSMYAGISDRRVSFEAFCRSALRMFVGLSGSDLHPELIGVSPKGVPLWRVPREVANA